MRLYSVVPAPMMLRSRVAKSASEQSQPNASSAETSV